MKEIVLCFIKWIEILTILTLVVSVVCDKLNLFEEGNDRKFANITQLICHDNKIFCLNNELDIVLIYNEEGMMIDTIQLDKGEKGISYMYIYKQKLCFCDKEENIYQYENGKIELKIKHSTSDENVYIVECLLKKNVLEKVKLPQGCIPVLYNATGIYYENVDFEEIFFYDLNNVDKKVDDKKIISKKEGYINGRKYYIRGLIPTLYRQENDVEDKLVGIRWDKWVVYSRSCKENLVFLLFGIILIKWILINGAEVRYE